MSLFDNPQESNFKSCESMVEAVLSKRGLNPEMARIQNDDGPAWGLTQGSAEIYIFLSASESGENFIQVVAPVMIPSHQSLHDGNLARRLLTLNACELTGCAFGLRENEIVLTADRSTTGLDPVELEEMIRRVSAYADYYDDILTVEFGGVRHADS